MARANPRNGRLEDAVVTLIQNQASFLARVSDMDRINSERFARIDERLARIEAVLVRQAQLLEALPEAVREKIGFKPTSHSSQ